MSSPFSQHLLLSQHLPLQIQSSSLTEPSDPASKPHKTWYVPTRYEHPIRLITQYNRFRAQLELSIDGTTSVRSVSSPKSEHQHTSQPAFTTSTLKPLSPSRSGLVTRGSLSDVQSSYGFPNVCFPCKSPLPFPAPSAPD